MKRRITEPTNNKNPNTEINLVNKSIVHVKNDEQPKQRTVISVSSSNNRRNRFKTLSNTINDHHHGTTTTNNQIINSTELSKTDASSSSSSVSISTSLADTSTVTTIQKSNKHKNELVNKINGSNNNLLIPTNLDSKSRTSCYFGIKCLSYNFNPEHRSIFAHPGDFDYKRPYFPPAPPGTPACPYGAECYRKNLNHFTQLSHPSNTLKRNYHKSSTQISSTTKNNLNSLSTDNNHYNNCDGGGGSDKLPSIDDDIEIKRRKKVLVFTTEIQQDDNDNEDEDDDLFLNDISDENDSEEEEDDDCDDCVEHNNLNINNYYKL